MKRWSPTLSLLMLCLLPSTLLAAWTQTAGPPTGNVSVLSVDPTNQDVYAVANEGAYRSRDGGATWQTMFNGLPGDFHSASIVATNSVVFVSGAEGAGAAIYRSTDRGDSWTAAGITGIPVPAVPVCFDINGSTILAGIHTGAGVYKSTDNGSTWTASNTGIAAGAGIGYFARSGTDLYAATSVISPTKAVYRSTDGGATWSATSFTLTGFASIIGLSSNANGVFVATNTAGVHRTTNNGTSFDKISAGGASDFATAVVATSTNVFIGNGSRVWRADANGDNWVAVNTGLPTSGAALTILSMAVSGSSVLAGEGKLGVYRSTDAGANWARSNTGLVASRINAGTIVDGSNLFVAADGAGFFRTSSNGDAWTGIDNGLEPYVGWYGFAKTGSTLLGGTSNFKIYRSDNDGDSWTLSNATLGLQATFVLLVDETTPSTVYAGGYSGVAKSVDSGMSWTTLASGIGAFQTVLCLWKDGPNMAYGTNGAFKRSTDSGDTWTAPFTGIPAVAAYGDFTQHDDTVYVGAAHGVYRSTDFGATWTATATFPGGAQSVLAIGIDLFAGGAQGVFHSNDGGQSWTASNEGFPSATHIMDLAANDGYLFAGGYRNGVWRRPLSEVTPALASLVSAEAEEGRVRVRWHVESLREVVIERRTLASDWIRLGSAAIDGEGFVTLDDDQVIAGERYGYRLRWGSGTQEVLTGEVWVDVPTRVELALHGARPNPAVNAPAIAFTIPRAGRVAIELLDLAGRRIGERYEAELGAGYHLLPMSSWRAPVGIYTARLLYKGESRTARFVMIR